MTDITTHYLATWNAVDATARRTLLEQHWTEQASYVDPLADVAGHAGLDAAIAGVHQQFPGFVFTALGAPDTHHDVTRFRWGLGPEGAEPLVEGFDVVRTDAAGRIASVVGFLDKVPA